MAEEQYWIGSICATNQNPLLYAADAHPLQSCNAVATRYSRSAARSEPEKQQQRTDNYNRNSPTNSLRCAFHAGMRNEITP